MQTEEKQSWVEGLPQAEAEECLAYLHRLAGQINSAMDAITQRKLSSLQESLHLQQLYCRRLADLRYRAADTLGSSAGPDVGSVDSDLALEIKAATESVMILNGRYSALLKHSGDTLRLLAGLYRNYRGFAQPASGSHASLPTWSCEI